MRKYPNSSMAFSAPDKQNKDNGFPIEIKMELLDLSLTPVMKDYPESCLPIKFKKSSGKKAKKLMEEQISPDMYEPNAQMVAFKIRRERLEIWIRALLIVYYEYYGKSTLYDVDWYDEPKNWDSDSNKTICVDIMKDQKLLYKITVFINTGVIQAQGHSRLLFANRDLPVLKTLLDAIG